MEFIKATPLLKMIKIDQENWYKYQEKFIYNIDKFLDNRDWKKQNNQVKQPKIIQEVKGRQADLMNNEEVLMGYVAYFLSRGKTIVTNIHSWDVPIIALSEQASQVLPWQEQELSVIDYVLMPLNGEYLGEYLRKICQWGLGFQTNKLHWFPK